MNTVKVWLIILSPRSSIGLELMPLKHRVLGSSPGGGTKRYLELRPPEMVRVAAGARTLNEEWCKD